MNWTLNDVDEELREKFCERIMDIHPDIEGGFDGITEDMIEDIKNDVLDYYVSTQYNHELLRIINLYGLNKAYKLSADTYGTYQGDNFTAHLAYVVVKHFDDTDINIFNDITSDKMLLKKYMEVEYPEYFEN
jgi:hypothetical protein